MKNKILSVLLILFFSITLFVSDASAETFKTVNVSLNSKPGSPQSVQIQLGKSAFVLNNEETKEIAISNFGEIGTKVPTVGIFIPPSLTLGGSSVDAGGGEFSQIDVALQSETPVQIQLGKSAFVLHNNETKEIAISDFGEIGTKVPTIGIFIPPAL